MLFFSCLHDRATVRSGAEIGLLSLRLSVCTRVPACPRARVPHREGNSMEVIEPFSATLAQDGLAEYDQPGKNLLKYSAVAGNRTRATGRTDSELFH